LKFHSWARPFPENSPALRGLAGDFVRMVEPHSEADPAALLVQFLAACGVYIGNGAYVVIDGSCHYCIIHVVVAGQSSKARKGSSWSHVERIFLIIDAAFVESCFVSGVGSGEGLIAAVADDPESGTPRDKRLLVFESEFCGMQIRQGREGSILAQVWRLAWDCARLGLMTRGQRVSVTGATIALIGHATVDELLMTTKASDVVGGNSNRIMWCLAKRRNLKPFGGRVPLEEMESLAGQVRYRLDAARQTGEVDLTPAAKTKWARLYYAMGATEAPGALKNVLSRAEPYILRLSLLYAMLDGAAAIDVPHLESAVALWDYAAESATYLFGDTTGNRTTDRIISLLSEAGEEGIARSDLHARVCKNASADVLSTALKLGEDMNLIRRERKDTGGRPSERWFSAQAQSRDILSIQEVPA